MSLKGSVVMSLLYTAEVQRLKTEVLRQKLRSSYLYNYTTFQSPMYPIFLTPASTQDLELRRQPRFILLLFELPPYGMTSGTYRLHRQGAALEL